MIFWSGTKEGISSDGWTVVKKKQKTKKLLCPQSTVSGVFNGSSRAPICKAGTKSSLGLGISGTKCSQIQVVSTPLFFQVGAHLSRLLLTRMFTPS